MTSWVVNIQQVINYSSRFQDLHHFCPDFTEYLVKFPLTILPLLDKTLINLQTTCKASTLSEKLVGNNALYSNLLKWGHLCIQWNSSIPTPWNEDTSVHSGTPLFQHPEMRTPLYTVELPLFQHPEMRTLLYTVELLYSYPLKWGHLCIPPEMRIPRNSSIPTP